MDAQLVALDAEQLQALLDVLGDVVSFQVQIVYVLFALFGAFLAFALIELFFGFWRK